MMENLRNHEDVLFQNEHFQKLRLAMLRFRRSSALGSV